MHEARGRNQLITAGAATLALAIGSPAVLRAEPAPGDVFREYTMPAPIPGWNPNHLFVIEENGGYVFTMDKPVDLTDAIKAEAVVEWANPHLTNSSPSISFNNGPWVLVPYPAAVPNPQNNYYVWAVQAVPVSLGSLKSGAGNTYKFQTSSGPNSHMGQYTTIFGVTLRIYYDPAKKAHPTGSIATPAPGSTIGRSAALSVAAQAAGGTIDRVEYLGNYEDIDVDGDGVYKGWVYTYFAARLTMNIATVGVAPAFQATWNTSWVPDQTGPVQIAARIVDNTGITYMTPAVSVILYRTDFSVELCKSYNVPPEYHPATFCYHTPNCQSSQTTNFRVTGDLKKLADAKIVTRIYWHDAWYPIKLNGITLNGFTVSCPMGPYFVSGALRPLSALKAGENVNITQGINYPDGVFITWPGMQYLLQYSAPMTAISAKPQTALSAQIDGRGTTNGGDRFYSVNGRRLAAAGDERTAAVKGLCIARHAGGAAQITGR